MTPPRFTAAPVPTATHGKVTRVATELAATCAACGDVAWTRDAATGLCRDCWRSGPWAAWWMGRHAESERAGVDFADEPPPGAT
jgi:hypothetical protein